MATSGGFQVNADGTLQVPDASTIASDLGSVGIPLGGAGGVSINIGAGISAGAKTAAAVGSVAAVSEVIASSAALSSLVAAIPGAGALGGIVSGLLGGAAVAAAVPVIGTIVAAVAAIAAGIVAAVTFQSQFQQYQSIPQFLYGNDNGGRRSGDEIASTGKQLVEQAVTAFRTKTNWQSLWPMYYLSLRDHESGYPGNPSRGMAPLMRDELAKSLDDDYAIWLLQQPNWQQMLAALKAYTEAGFITGQTLMNEGVPQSSIVTNPLQSLYQDILTRLPDAFITNYLQNNPSIVTQLAATPYVDPGAYAAIVTQITTALQNAGPGVAQAISDAFPANVVQFLFGVDFQGNHVTGLPNTLVQAFAAQIGLAGKPSAQDLIQATTLVASFRTAISQLTPYPTGDEYVTAYNALMASAQPNVSAPSDTPTAFGIPIAPPSAPDPFGILSSASQTYASVMGAESAWENSGMQVAVGQLVSPNMVTGLSQMGLTEQWVLTKAAGYTTDDNGPPTAADEVAGNNWYMTEGASYLPIPIQGYSAAQAKALGDAAAAGGTGINLGGLGSLSTLYQAKIAASPPIKPVPTEVLPNFTKVSLWQRIKTFFTSPL